MPGSPGRSRGDVLDCAQRSRKEVLSDGCHCVAQLLACMQPVPREHLALAERSCCRSARPRVCCSRFWPRVPSGATDSCTPRPSRRRSSRSSTTASSPTVLYPIKSGKEATVYCCRGGRELRRPTGRRQGLQAARVPLVPRRRDLSRRPRHPRQARRPSRQPSAPVRPEGPVARCGPNHEWEILKHAARGRRRRAEPLAHSAGAHPAGVHRRRRSGAPSAQDCRSAAAKQPKRLFERLLDNVQLWLAYDIVHGDLSAYNVLYRPTRPVVIDFPQAVDPRFNTQRVSTAARATSRTWRGYFARSASSATRSRWPNATGRSGSGRR